MTIKMMELATLLLYLINNSISRGSETRMTSQRLNPRQIFEFHGYKDVQVFHYRVPDQTLLASWNFTARERQKCDHRNVSLYLKHSSFPVVNPDGGSFPSNFRVKGATTMRELFFQSDGVDAQLNITNPEPGDWLAIAFLQVDSNRIEQKGLAPYCSTFLDSRLNLVTANNTILVIPELQNYHEIQLFQDIEETQSITYKFYVPVDTRLVLVNLTRCMVVGGEDTGTNPCPLQLIWSPRALPDLSNPGNRLTNCSESTTKGTCQISFVPWEEDWHYVTVHSPTNNVSYSLKVIFQTCTSDNSVPRYRLVNDLDTKDICSSVSKSSKFRVVFQNTKQSVRQAPEELCWDRVPLMRRTFSTGFMFEYDLYPNPNGSIPLLLEISTRKPTIMSFPVHPIIDIGGTLNFEIGINPLGNFTNYSLSVVACLTHKSRLEPKFNPARCDDSDYAVVQVNSSISGGSMSRALIAYPEPGMWHVTLRAFCFVTDDANITEEVVCEKDKEAFFFGISSDSCVYGGCGPFGRCYQSISASFIFSTCTCSAGFRGWGCTDGTEAIPNTELLQSTLLLTLSNLLFIPSIVLAVYRHFFTEALVYLCTMFFSAFYHACDDDAFAFCLLHFNVMQFCDFYSAILAFWVTLVAMSDLPASLTSFLHMSGAIGVALGIEYDRTGLIVFMVPTLSGIAILAVSWAMHCRKSQSCYPTKKYWLMCLPPGLILASGGLVCYAFFETERNYQYVHSVWHATMALSIACFLPFKRVEAVKTKLTWRGLEA